MNSILVLGTIVAVVVALIVIAGSIQKIKINKKRKEYIRVGKLRIDELLEKERKDKNK